MAIDGLTPAIVFPIFNFVLRSVQTAYEIASVPAETSDYLKTISHIMTVLNTAKQLRRQKANFMTREELSEVDNAILKTEDAMKGVELLVERARVDMSIIPGNVSAGSRIMWVVRDQHKVGPAMNRLAIVSQSLHREIITMRGAQAPNVKYDQGEEICDHGRDDLKSPWEDHSSSSTGGIWQPAPPTYLQATIDGMRERRLWNERRNSLVKRGFTSRNVTPTSPTIPTTTFPSFHEQFDDDEIVSATMNSIADWIKHNENMLSVLAPSASAAPRDTFLPATIVNVANDIDFQNTIAELPGDTPHPSMQPRRPATTSPPQIPPNIVPQVPINPFRQMTLQQLIDPTLSPPDPPTKPRATHHPSKTRSRPPPPPPQPRRKRRSQSPVSNLMESTTLIPGHRKPLILRWKEDTGDEIHTAESYADIREATRDHEPYIPSSRNSSINGGDDGDDDSGYEPLIDSSNHPEPEDISEPPLRRRTTRRRPPQFHGTPNPVGTDMGTDVGTSPNTSSRIGSTSAVLQSAHAQVVSQPQREQSQTRHRSHGSSSSAQRWRIQNQIDELARLGL